MRKSFVQTIFTAIQEGLQEDYQSFTSNRKLITSNSKCSLRWDIVNTNLNESLQNIEIAFPSMGFWKFALLLDKENRELYTLMNRKRYDNIIKNPTKNAPLYMRALVNLNENLGVLAPTLFPIEDEEQNKELYKILNKLCNSFSAKNDFENVRYNIIVFTTDSFGNVIDLTSKILDIHLNVLHSYKLLDDVSPIHSNIIEQASSEDKNEPILKLKRKAELRKGEESKVSLRNDDVLNEKHA